MGQEADAEKRRHAFAGFQVDSSMLDMAKGDVMFMHPLPAHNGEEVAAGLLNDPRSVVFDQAENRLHLQKALLVKLLSEGSGEWRGPS
jgi:ornithine carbamoyltransferase